MAELLRMPQVSTSTTEAVLSRWPVAEGAAFAARDVLATVETDKALVDVEAEVGGVLLKVLVAEGAEVAVGSAIAVLGEPGDLAGDVEAVLLALGVASPAPTAVAAPVAPVAPVAPLAPVVSAVGGPAGTGRVFASPLARRLAGEAGLLVEDLEGTGPGGRIVRRDVEAAVARRVAPEEPAVAPDPPVAPVVPAQGTPEPAPDLGWVDRPLSRSRRATAARLSASKATAPHFYVRGTARVDELLALRGALNSSGDVRVSINDLVVKAVGHAHRLVPAMNVAWTGDAIRSFAGVDVAVAVATERGLVTPVLRSVERQTLSALAGASRDLVERARAGRLQQRDLEGGSITVTNLGMHGTEEFAAILNPPQAAILAVGAARQEAVVTDGRLEVGTVLRVTLSVDHRPVDGAVAAEWLQALLALLEAPVRILV